MNASEKTRAALQNAKRGNQALDFIDSDDVRLWAFDDDPQPPMQIMTQAIDGGVAVALMYKARVPGSLQLRVMVANYKSRTVHSGQMVQHLHKMLNHLHHEGKVRVALLQSYEDEHSRPDPSITSLVCGAVARHVEISEWSTHGYALHVVYEDEGLMRIKVKGLNPTSCEVSVNGQYRNIDILSNGRGVELKPGDTNVSRIPPPEPPTDGLQPPTSSGPTDLGR